MKFDDLIALNDHLLALSRAGFPIDASLRTHRRLSRELDTTTRQIERRLSQGESLEAVLSDQALEIPAFYLTAIATATRTGNLASCTESIAHSLQRVVQLRRIVRRALLYPATVWILACVLAALLLQPVVIPVAENYAIHGITPPPWLSVLTTALRALGPVAGLLPLIPLAIFALWWWRARWSVNSARTPLALIPGAARMLRLGRLAIFTELLQLLVSNRVPLLEGLPLAASASGDPIIQAEAQRAADRIARGDVHPFPISSGKVNHAHHEGIPTLLAMLLQSSSSNRDLIQSLRRLSSAYAQRCHSDARRMSIVLPVAATFTIGGSVALIYAMVFLAPWYTFLSRLGSQI